MSLPQDRIIVQFPGVPELAEVELARRQWAEFHHETILAIESHGQTRIYRDCPSVALRILKGKKLTSSRTHGKRMFFTFEPELHLEVHLGMTGKLYCASATHEAHRHDHLIFRLSNASLVFSDYRQFGRVMLHDVVSPWIDFPPQPQERKFSVSYIQQKLTRHGRKPLKGFLLDQSICPGIGNWMADEICWKMGSHPATPSGEIKASAIQKATRFVTLGALKYIADKNSGPSTEGFAPGTYVEHVPPKSWLFQHRWKSGGHCPKCGTELERATIATRTTAWCSQCQK